ncbi:MAG: PRC-barrel domain-containing protein [Bacteroidota bacterium]
MLIPSMFLKETDWNKQHFEVELSKADLERCPAIEENLPVSRKYEELINRNYHISDYWSRDYYPLNAIPGITGNYLVPAEPVRMPGKIIREADIDTNLRSYNELIGYEVLTSDGKLGHIEDLLIDSSDWSVISTIVDTHKLQPWSKKVIIAVTWTEEISYLDKTITVSLSTEEVKNAPDFNPKEPVNEVYEKNLYDYYGKSVKKH